MKYEKRDLKGSEKIITFPSLCIVKHNHVLILYFVKEKNKHPEFNFSTATIVTFLIQKFLYYYI